MSAALRKCGHSYADGSMCPESLDGKCPRLGATNAPGEAPTESSPSYRVVGSGQDHLEIWHDVQVPGAKSGSIEPVRLAWATRDNARWIETGVRFDDAEGARNDGPLLRLIEEAACPRAALEALERKLLGAAAVVRALLERTQ